MFTVCLLLSALIGSTIAVSVTEVDAPGERLVSLGDTVQLLLPSTGKWTSCLWILSNERYCKLNLNQTTAETQMSLNKFQDSEVHVEVDPDHPGKCAIQITNITKEVVGNWRVRFIEDIIDQVVKLSLAEPIAKLAVEVVEEEIRENDKVTVRCEATGGNPTAELSLRFKDSLNNTLEGEDDTEYSERQLTQTEEGTVLQAVLIASPVLSGRTPACTAVQRNQNNQTLFRTVEEAGAALDVKFGPKPVGDNITETVMEEIVGYPAVFTLEFSANPIPDSVVWTITNSTCANTTTADDLSTCSFTPEKDSKEFVTSELEKVPNTTNVWKAELIIPKTSDSDFALTLDVNITNGIGSYLGRKFSLKKVTTTTTTTTTPAPVTKPSQKPGTTTETSPNKTNGSNFTGVTVFGLLILVTILGIILLTIYKKRQGSKGEMQRLTETN